MESLQAIGILVVFLGMVVALMTRRSLLSLPCNSAVLFCLIAGMPFMSSASVTTIMTNVLEKGLLCYGFHYGSGNFGAIFGAVLNNTGFQCNSKAPVGRRRPCPSPWHYCSAALIFSSATFVGITIGGHRTLPIMMSVGISPLVANCYVARPSLEAASTSLPGRFTKTPLGWKLGPLASTAIWFPWLLLQS